MGIPLSKAIAKIFGNKEMRILMLGLDAAGKTSMLHLFFYFPFNSSCSHVYYYSFLLFHKKGQEGEGNICYYKQLPSLLPRGAFFYSLFHSFGLTSWVISSIYTTKK